MVRTVRRRLVWNGGRIARSGKNQSWCWQRLVGPVFECALHPHRVPQANTPFFGRGRLIAPRISKNAIAPVVPGRKTRKQTDISQWERLLAASHHEVRQPGSETALGDPREDNREYNAVCHCGSTKAALNLAQRRTEFPKETISMSETLALPKDQIDEHKEKYFSFQIKGWTNFDPMDKTLARIAEGLENGGGFLKLIEVLRVEGELASIDDEEVRECFANILAAKRLVRNIHELPKKLIEELRSALKTEEEVVPQKPVRQGAISSVNESAPPAKFWPGPKFPTAMP
jgi:hypothetical protein